jgi:hypothetical protein
MHLIFWCQVLQRLTTPRFVLTFLSPSRKLTGQNLGIGYDHFSIIRSFNIRYYIMFTVEEMSLNKQKLNQSTDPLPYFLYFQAVRVCIPILTNLRGMKRGVPPAARTMGS